MSSDVPQPKRRRLHPWPVRVMHWTNAVAMIVMIGSGWGIYNDSVIFQGFGFPRALVIGDWAAKSLLWHFAAMWFLVVNGAFYLVYGLASGRLRERLLPIRAAEVIRTTRDALRFKLAHDDPTTYNAVQKILYIVAIAAGSAQVVSGIAVWKPVQFSGLLSLLGGFQGARLVHFAGMSVLVGFLVVHVALALLVPQTLWAMLTGGPPVRSRASVSRPEAAS